MYCCQKIATFKYLVFVLQQTPGHTPAHTPSNSRWDETPGRAKGSETPGTTPSTRIWDPTPSHTPAGAATPGRDTPGHATPGHGGATGSHRERKNRWDETPKTERETPGQGSGWLETPRTDHPGEDTHWNASHEHGNAHTRYTEVSVVCLWKLWLLWAVSYGALLCGLQVT